MQSAMASTSRTAIAATRLPRRSLASSAYFPPRAGGPSRPPAPPSSPPQSASPPPQSASPPPQSASPPPQSASPPPQSASPHPPPHPAPSATTSTPQLSPSEHALVSSIIRVDQAGELGANWIYRGQKYGSLLRGDTSTARQVSEMWENEKHHLNTMALLRAQHDVRPTALYPLWQGLAFGLGLGTALLGREAAMACTEAVETVIGEHYDDQIRALKPLIEKHDHPSLPLLRDVLKEFRDDELEHLDTAVEEGAQKAPGHSLLSAVIGAGCKAAIKVCEKI